MPVSSAPEASPLIPATTPVDRGGRRPPLLLVIAVVVVAGELAARLIGPHLPVVRHAEQEVFVKADQMRALEPGGGAPIVFVGDSMLDAAVDPDRFDAASQAFDGSYNASLVGLPPSRAGDWLETVVLDELDPSVVVIGWHPSLLTVAPTFTLVADTDFDEAYRVNIAQAVPSRWRDAEQWFADHSALIEYRQGLRNPADVLEAIGRMIRGEESDENAVPTKDEWSSRLTARGSNIAYRAAQAPQTDPALSAQYESGLAGGWDLAPLRRLIRDLHDDGRDVVVVVPPIDVQTLVAGGLDPTWSDEIMTDLHQLADDDGTPIIDLREGFGPEHFHDKQHLAQPGVDLFNDRLAVAVDDLCATVLASC